MIEFGSCLHVLDLVDRGEKLLEGDYWARGRRACLPPLGSCLPVVHVSITPSLALQGIPSHYRHWTQLSVFPTLTASVKAGQYPLLRWLIFSVPRYTSSKFEVSGNFPTIPAFFSPTLLLAINVFLGNHLISLALRFYISELSKIISSRFPQKVDVKIKCKNIDWW